MSHLPSELVQHFEMCTQGDLCLSLPLSWLLHLSPAPQQLVLLPPTGGVGLAMYTVGAGMPPHVVYSITEAVNCEIAFQLSCLQVYTLHRFQAAVIEFLVSGVSQPMHSSFL